MHIIIQDKMDLDFTRKPTQQVEPASQAQSKKGKKKKHQEWPEDNEDQVELEIKQDFIMNKFKLQATERLVDACMKLSQSSIMPILDQVSTHDVYTFLFGTEEMPLNEEDST